MSTEAFYQALPAFKSFSELTSDAHFQKVPADWCLIITDVKGSTKAIADGRYKDVNTIGAASIVVARKAMGKKDFPFVFGGDGATLLIPPQDQEQVLKELCALKKLAQTNFHIDLRVGMVKVSELYELNSTLEVAKFELTEGRHVATLRGSGVNLAEEKIKNQREQYEINLSPDNDADLTGLSCRWLPIPAKRGKILTLLISARGNDKAVYQHVLNKLESIFPEGIESLNPAISEASEYKSILQCFKDEYKYHAHKVSLSFIKRFMEIIHAVILFKYRLPIPFFRKYQASMQTHSDFRKFDNMLRMVIDCSPEKSREVKSFLEDLYLKKEIFYGWLESDNSLMTCFVEGLNQGEHIHFMDAENGGYASAAVKLKEQMKKAYI